MRKLYIAATAVLLSACTSAETEPDETSPQQTVTPDATEEPTVHGEDRLDTITILHLAEEEYDAVGPIQLPEPVILYTADEWNTWFDETIPETLHDEPDLISPSFENTAVVAGTFHSCTEQSFLTSEADEVFFHIASAPDEEHIDCAWSPNRIVAYEISLDQFDSPTAVTIYSEYIYSWER